MSGDGFWESAWSTLAQLEAGPSHVPDKSALLARLTADLSLQRSVFVVRGFAEPAWLAPFRNEGLFDTPPPVEPVEGGLRASGWPALAYLREVVAGDPRVCADVLESLRSDNWWVIS